LPGKQRRIKMLYTEFVNKAVDLTIEEAPNGLFYLEPMWRSILYIEGIDITDVSEKIEWSEVEDILKLEVEKRNTVNSKLPKVVDWLHELVTVQIEPAMLQEETEYMKQIIEFQKRNGLTEEPKE